MEEKIKLVIVLAEESKHAVGSSWGKQRSIFPAERNHVGIGAVEKNMLLILDIISLADLFHLLLSSGVLPQPWLKTKITPLHKKGAL